MTITFKWLSSLYNPCKKGIIFIPILKERYTCKKSSSFKAKQICLNTKQNTKDLSVYNIFDVCDDPLT